MAEAPNAPTLEYVRDRRDTILNIAAAHGAHNVRVFGSVVRGSARSDSNSDFLVELEPDCTALDLSGLILDLQDALGYEVGVVEVGGASRVAERIRAEAIPL